MNSIIYLGIDVHTTNFTFCALSITLGEAPKVIAENQTEADGFGQSSRVLSTSRTSIIS